MKQNTPADFAQQLGSMRSAQTLLARYQHQGYVSKVRRGLYCANNIATLLPEANKYQVASAITPSSFVAYHAAMEYHGLAHQVYYDVAVGSEQAFNPFDFELAKTEVLLFIENLLYLTDSETAFIDAFVAKEYHPELLFDDEQIIKNIYNHPMAYWKIK
ncbi:MAG: hypothetical protein IJ047_01725 [Paludibacteraceae bacterium]|nr:hypothetical protein [Paludibacteraceae bacterium]